MKAKMETAAGRSAGRPTLALTRSRSLCVPQPTEGTNDELNSHARRLLAARLDAAAQRARPSTIKILCPACPRRRPSRIHHAGCIEFIPSWVPPPAEREEDERRTLPFSFKRPRTRTHTRSRGFPTVTVLFWPAVWGWGCSWPWWCKNMVEQPNELARPFSLSLC